MKKVISLIALSIIVLWGCSSPKTDVQEYVSFEQAKFKEPDNTFRSVPFYSLNDSLSAEELARQLKLMKEGGFGGAFLHSRIGLLTPYLSEEWFQIMEAGVKACQELDMDAWFYDEDKWPSGFAGGIIPMQDDAFRYRTLVRFPKDRKVEECDELLFEDDQYKYVAYIDRMGNSWYNGTSWVDLMNPNMVKAFIECSYKPYIERFAGQPHVLGIFSDEPQVSPRPVEGSLGSISYSPYVETAFEKLWGYKIRPVIPSLYEEVGDWRTIRLHYYRTIAYCMDQAFSKPIADYCAEHNFIWTGHYNAEQTPTGTMQNEGNLMHQLRRMQMPGIDALGLYYSTVHNAKVNTSTANQYGIDRRLSELFGISGQNMSFEDRMWITAWHTIMGVNFMCPHLYLYSMKGERKRDCPPTLSHQQPYWSQNKLFEDYSARLCYFATAGSTKGEVCVLTPIESDFIDAPVVDSGSEASPTWDRSMERILQQLMSLQVNSDLGDEQIIAETGSVEGKTFKIGEMAYQVVILPPMLTIRPHTLKLLYAFAKQGGTILVYDSYPQLVEGKEDSKSIEELKSISTLVSKNTLKDAVEKGCNRVFSIEGEKKELVWSHLREVKGGYTLQLSNTSRLESLSISLNVDLANGKVALWNPIDGSCLSLNADDKGCYTIEFSPIQTWILTIGNLSENVVFDGTYQIKGERTQLMTLKNEWNKKRVHSNALPLDFASYSIDGGKSWSKAEPVLGIYDRFKTKPHNGPLSLRYSFQIKDIPSVCSLVIEQPHMYTGISMNGTAITFSGDSTYIDHTFQTTDIRSLLKKGQNEVLLTLNNISAIPTSTNAHARYGTEIETIYLIGDFGVQGTLAKDQPTDTWRNYFKSLEPKPMPTRFQYGSFVLTKELDDVCGDLARQGYPFYAGQIELSQSFDVASLDKEKGKYILKFNDLETILVTVRLNGKELPTIFSNPWECDVTEALKEGKNELTLILTNSLRNLMGPYHHMGAEFAKVAGGVFRGDTDWPNLVPGDADWYDARIRGNAKLWRDDYYSIPFGLLSAPVLDVENKQ